MRELSQTPSNLMVCPSLSKDTFVGTRMENGGKQASRSKESILNDVMNKMSPGAYGLKCVPTL